MPDVPHGRYVRAKLSHTQYPPGGLTDGVARTLAPRLTEMLGQQVYVDNRPGGGSTIATELAAKAPPDGHTLLVADQALITNPSLYAKLPFDTLKELQPVALVGAAALVIVAHPSLPVRSVKRGFPGLLRSRSQFLLSRQSPPIRARLSPSTVFPC